jgi:hypothetical protein
MTPPPLPLWSSPLMTVEEAAVYLRILDQDGQPDRARVVRGEEDVRGEEES